MKHRQLLGAIALIAVGLILIVVGRFFRGVDEADAPAASAPSSVVNTEDPSDQPVADSSADGLIPSRLALAPGAGWEETVQATFTAQAAEGETGSRLEFTGRRLGRCYRVEAGATLIGLRYDASFVQDGERFRSLDDEFGAEILVVLDARNRITHVGLPGDVSDRKSVV